VGKGPALSFEASTSDSDVISPVDLRETRHSKFTPRGAGVE
jgi:hypothetical protein